MSIRLVREGDRFGHLTVIRDRDGSEARIACRCDCGVEVTPRLDNLTSGRTTSCGCSRRGEGNHRWNGAPESHPLYSSWCNMKQRCGNPSNKSYPNYGGRGITVCERWADDFWTFAQHLGDRPEGHTLDRIDNDGNYEPGNCRWATASEQCVNQRSRPPKDSCKRDHPFTEDNTRLNSRGDRVCLTCERDRARSYRSNQVAS